VVVCDQDSRHASVTKAGWTLREGAILGPFRKDSTCWNPWKATLQTLEISGLDRRRSLG
jgi:hypothetical protein